MKHVPTSVSFVDAHKSRYSFPLSCSLTRSRAHPTSLSLSPFSCHGMEINNNNKRKRDINESCSSISNNDKTPFAQFQCGDFEPQAKKKIKQ